MREGGRVQIRTQRRPNEQQRRPEEKRQVRKGRVQVVHNDDRMSSNNVRRKKDKLGEI
jgi:hypothetical protein